MKIYDAEWHEITSPISDVDGFLIPAQKPNGVDSDGVLLFEDCLMFRQYTEEEKKNKEVPRRVTALEGAVAGLEQWEQAFKRGVQSA